MRSIRFPCNAEGFAFRDGFRTLDLLDVDDTTEECLDVILDCGGDPVSDEGNMEIRDMGFQRR